MLHIPDLFMCIFSMDVNSQLIRGMATSSHLFLMPCISYLYATKLLFLIKAFFPSWFSLHRQYEYDSLRSPEFWQKLLFSILTMGSKQVLSLFCLESIFIKERASTQTMASSIPLTAVPHNPQKIEIWQRRQFGKEFLVHRKINRLSCRYHE